MLATMHPRQIPSMDPTDHHAGYVEAYVKLIGQLHFYIVACFAVFVWDTLITLPDEIGYVWPSRLTLVKICFFVNRYLTLILMAFLVACSFSPTLTEHCGKFHLFQAYTPIVIFLCCNYKLVQRASSLFHEPRLAFYSLSFVVIAQAVVQAVVSIKNKPIPMPPGITGCYSFPIGGNENYAFVYWLLPLFTQTIVLVITLWKVIQYWTMHGRSHLLEIFLRDGVHFFAVTASSNIVNVVYMKSKISIDGHKLSGANFNSALALIINSMMVSRLIIHMRLALADHTTVTYNTESQSPKLQAGTAFENFRSKLGFPTLNRASYYRNRRKDHHTEHGVTTIVDLPVFEKTGNTFTPVAARDSGTREVGYASSSTRKDGGTRSTNSSTEDISIKEMLAQMPTSLPACHERGITFDLPGGTTPPSRVTQTGRVDRLDPELMGLNRRPNTGGSAVSIIRHDPPVLFVGENYHHRADVTPSSSGVINMKNAIIVTTEKIVKTEGGMQDEE